MLSTILGSEDAQLDRTVPLLWTWVLAFHYKKQTCKKTNVVITDDGKRMRESITGGRDGEQLEECTCEQ